MSSSHAISQRHAPPPRRVLLHGIIIIIIIIILLSLSDVFFLFLFFLVVTSAGQHQCQEPKAPAQGSYLLSRELFSPAVPSAVHPRYDHTRAQKPPKTPQNPQKTRARPLFSIPHIFLMFSLLPSPSGSVCDVMANLRRCGCFRTTGFRSTSLRTC